jgi:hypothetical protein
MLNCFMVASNAYIFFQQCVSRCPSLLQKELVLGGFFFFDLSPLWDCGGVVIVGDLASLMVYRACVVLLDLVHGARAPKEFFSYLDGLVSLFL